MDTMSLFFVGNTATGGLLFLIPYVAVSAALAAGILAYFVRRRVGAG